MFGFAVVGVIAIALLPRGGSGNAPPIAVLEHA
jgi:hypothetical protein